MPLASVGGAILGGSLISGLLGSRASSKAADTQAAASDRASETQWRMYDQSRQDQMPWLKTGRKSLADLAMLMGKNGQLRQSFGMDDFYRDPGYQFALNEGRNTIQNSAAAHGLLNSGATLKALARFGQDYAGTKYNEAYNRYNNDQTTQFNRLAALANVGQTTAGNLGNLGANTAAQIGQNYTNAGMARASGQIGQANAINDAISNGIGLYGAYKNGFFS